MKLDSTLATEFISERAKYEENARKLTLEKAGKNFDALALEFLGKRFIVLFLTTKIGVDINSNIDDKELIGKMQEFEEWLKK